MEKAQFCQELASMAVQALVDEVLLSPKPGLVDQYNNGSHKDLSLVLMLNSAEALSNTFYKMAKLSYGKTPSFAIREAFGAIGRDGEKQMFAVTNGINTHKGAIWSLGLLVSAYAMKQGKGTARELCETAGALARFEDRYIPNVETNGRRVIKKYGVHGAKQEAQMNFPHVQQVLPVYERYQQQGDSFAKHRTLLALISSLDDTCILHRGGLEGLSFAQYYAKQLGPVVDMASLHQMNEAFVQRNLSPGGSADLFAATLFVYTLVQEGKKNLLTIRGV